MSAPERAEAARQSAECLYKAEEVVAAVDRLAVRLTVALAEENPLLLCVLNGGLPFTGALMQRLQFPLTLSYVHVGRYGDATRGGELTWHARPREDVEGRHVVLIDDILDEGVTLAALEAWCMEEGASAVTSAVLLEKGEGGRATFAALPCPDRYVFGWGMDFEGYWRNLPAIYALDESLETSRQASR
ncbi:MAG: hypoxanthine-guanine phosphoribosyltransferase [Gammaproteobacteria bacterium]|nr:MAG: hypoxanthine-guanine phosphoribosyltransferase [Gammaproteobacteria bacterium]